MKSLGSSKEYTESPTKELDKVSIAASKIVGNLYDRLKFDGAKQDLERFLVRLVFCFFADNTGIFEPRGIFLDSILNETREDGTDLGRWLTQLFLVLNQPIEERQKNLDEVLDKFPHINGELFKDYIQVPSFDTKTRELVVKACQFDWSSISPAIFGSLFQFVMDQEERRTQGAHYTTEYNIMKVIEPLFLNQLKTEFEKLKKRRDRGRITVLKKFQKKLSNLTFFDPACGCGNFLVVAYREIRKLEIDVIQEIRKSSKERDQLELALSFVNVNQFYGIEISEFPVRIAESALWMMDHIMNNQLSMDFGEIFIRIPIIESPNIHCCDALETDWNEILPSDKCTYLLGNPPFVGAKLQSDIQSSQMNQILRKFKIKNILDYVAAWILIAGEYIKGEKTRIGFVATSSISQGEQCSQLWPKIFDELQLEIAFAHRSFNWISDSPGGASVNVIILGLTTQEEEIKKRPLYSYEIGNLVPKKTMVNSISPYLFDAKTLSNPHITVQDAQESICGLPEMKIGSKPIDGGNYIFSDQQKSEFVNLEPNAKKFFRPFIGNKEFVNGNKRWILALDGVEPSKFKSLPRVMERISAVRNIRLQSSSSSTRKLAETPLRFHVTVIPKKPFLVIPEVNSDQLDYIPIGWLKPPIIPSNLVKIVENANLSLFGLVTSRMHMTWLQYIGGRLGNSMRYSIGSVYNTFPVPKKFESENKKLEQAAQQVLDERNKHKNSNLSVLYHPDSMPTTLRNAHQKLDSVVDKLYKSSKFHSDVERISHLLSLYETMV